MSGTDRKEECLLEPLCVSTWLILLFAEIVKKTVYDVPDLMTNVTSVKRFIDDGAAAFSGEIEEFELQNVAGSSKQQTL